jgi:hypothetical protein
MINLAAAPGSLGFDVRLYRLAAESWLAGRDPWAPGLAWDAAHTDVSYAGPPPTLLPFLGLSWAPIDALTLVFMLASAAAAIWTLRRLELPLWWLAFPPIVECIWVGNLNLFVLALLIGGGVGGRAIAAILKIYAIVPLAILAKWRPILLASALILVTAPVLPWGEFVHRYSDIAGKLAEQAWGSTQNVLPTTPLVAGAATFALVLLGRDRSAWLAVPALWPSTQLHYSVLALPALSPGLAFFAAVPQRDFLTMGIVVYALWIKRHTLGRLVGDARSRIDMAVHDA